MRAPSPRISALLRPASLALGLLACASGLVVGCSCGADRVAELTAAQGIVDRDEAAPGDQWRTTVVGETYTWDEAVRTAPDATASLVLGGSNGIRMQPGTVIRFLRQPSDQAGIEVTSGEAELESSGTGLALVTHAGTVQLEAGTRIRLRAGPAEHIEVVAGRVEFEDGLSVQAGQAVLVEVGSVVLEDTTPDAAVIEPDAGPLEDAFVPGDDAGVDAFVEPLPEGEDEVEVEGGPLQPSPARAHIAIAAGESLTLHDPAAPTAVRIDLPATCTGQTFVSLSSGGRGVRFEGSGAIIVSVPAGRFRYSVRCGGGGSAPGGTLSVRRDDGSLRLESVPPRNLFDADGRRYDVLYQNALPIVTFRWASAGGGPYQVEVVSSGRTRVLPSPSSSLVFDSGALRDGEHRLTFLAGGRRSPTTIVRVRFDNAAPTAYIREPRGTVARGAVHVSGMAIEGATVSVGGTPLTLDGDNRFEGDVTAPAELDAIAIRFAHPRSGVHYYLRRVSP
ncbi:MAG: hypothetical protein K1X94_25090 [Sandaracinaceae bacterium]|nr:hypothetical protein [Sandaracinaceae bacterium]